MTSSTVERRQESKNKKAPQAVRVGRSAIDTQALKIANGAALKNLPNNAMPWRFAATAQETERERIARDLHDVLGQNIVALRIGLNRLLAKVQGNDEAEAAIKKLEALTTEMGNRVHYLTLELRPSSLDDLGLCSSIEAFVEHWTDRFGIKADFHSTISERVRLDSLVESMAYRIVQEALTNVAKHSKATHVDVVIETHLEQLVLVVEDNGCGFDVDSVISNPDPESYLGLQGMIERASMAGGKLAIDSDDNQGTTVILRIPRGEEQ